MEDNHNIYFCWHINGSEDYLAHCFTDYCVTSSLVELGGRFCLKNARDNQYILGVKKGLGQARNPAWAAVIRTMYSDCIPTVFIYIPLCYSVVLCIPLYSVCIPLWFIQNTVNLGFVTITTKQTKMK